MLQHVAFRVIAKSMMCNRKVRFVRIKHAKAIVMLRGENHVTHTSILTDGSPLRGIELRRTKLVCQREIPIHILLVGEGSVSRNPVFVTDRP